MVVAGLPGDRSFSAENSTIHTADRLPSASAYNVLRGSRARFVRGSLCSPDIVEMIGLHGVDAAIIDLAAYEVTCFLPSAVQR
jgi:hypothetical protein